ncbi:hypothetical protein PQQ52_28570 [Paraburkholderia sediminicola]|uniref:hypothetical protein n=1 Tax=Paraburkholderia sediminicola TaxID=458836 RepID=UPI0038B81E4E
MSRSRGFAFFTVRRLRGAVKGLFVSVRVCPCGGLLGFLPLGFLPLGFLPSRRFGGLCACGVGLVLFACAALDCLFACGVGLSLITYWIISVCPCAGRHLLSLPPQRKISKENGSHR